LVSPPASKKPSTTTTLGSGAFYDGFRLPDGRLAVAIGEVVGGGVVAVGQVRACLRAAAVTSSDLDAIFAALDELVSGPKQPTVRALLGIFEPATGELLLASAGHFPPVVVRGSAATEAQGCLQRRAAFAEVENGPSLGIPGSRPVLRLVLREGDALVAFTDGLIDGKAEGQTPGQPILLEALSGIASTTPRSICHHVADEVIGDQALDDECALLAVVRDSEVHQLATVLVPPQAGAVLEARRWVRVLLQSWGLDEETAADAVLGVSELVTNVVLYAGTPARVSVELADRLLVTVEDTGTTGVPELDLPEDPTAVRGRGLVLVAAMSDSMGHARGVGGSTVWFEIALGGRAAATQGRS
jgi:anti-sigma regulatory factor (Ser/Thr protein kinase)